MVYSAVPPSTTLSEVWLTTTPAASSSLTVTLMFDGGAAPLYPESSSASTECRIVKVASSSLESCNVETVISTALFVVPVSNTACAGCTVASPSTCRFTRTVWSAGGGADKLIVYVSVPPSTTSASLKSSVTEIVASSSSSTVTATSTAFLSCRSRHPSPKALPWPWRRPDRHPPRPITMIGCSSSPVRWSSNVRSMLGIQWRRFSADDATVTVTSAMGSAARRTMTSAVPAVIRVVTLGYPDGSLVDPNCSACNDVVVAGGHLDIHGVDDLRKCQFRKPSWLMLAISLVSFASSSTAIVTVPRTIPVRMP